MKLGKIEEWFKRYAFAESVAIIFEVGLANLILLLFNNIYISAFIAGWGGTIGYYNTIIFQDILTKRRSTKVNHKDIIFILRNIVFEFSVADFLDNTTIRPFYFSIMPKLIGNYSIAITIGAILASISFYIITILFYEIRKKFFKH